MSFPRHEAEKIFKVKLHIARWKISVKLVVMKFLTCLPGKRKQRVREIMGGKYTETDHA